MSSSEFSSSQISQPFGLYFHWPFCLSKCPYCDFNTHVRGSVDYDVWLAAYLKALEHYAAMTPGRICASIFFGGGTPSLMKPAMVETIIQKVRDLWPCANDLEITLEANPTSVEIGKFRDFAAAGVNRVSMGVQALNDKDLAFLGRQHSVEDAMRAFEVAKACFERANFDLIYARPEQTIADWEEELSRAAEFLVGHLSVYQLTIERNTPFYKAHQEGVFSIPDQDIAADFYTLTQDVLAGLGLPAYEVSNHARTGEESRHNLIYWRYRDYIGIGPGAHGRLTLEDGVKYAMRDHASPDGWLSHIAKNGHGAHPYKALSEADQAFESLMMGLRLFEGMHVSAQHWKYLKREAVQVLSDQGWLSYSEDHITLTLEGMLRLNAVLPYIFKSEGEQVIAAA